MPVPAFADIGKGAGEVLKGSKDGVFQFDQKFAVSTKTSDGIALALAAINKGDKTDLSLRATYGKINTLSAVFNTTDKVALTATLGELAPGLKATLAATLPDPQSGKLTLDYLHPYANLKISSGLTSAPKVTLAATTGYKDFILGAEATADVAKSVLTGYSAGIGYHRPDSQIAAVLTDKGETLKVLIQHNFTATESVAAEVTRPVFGKETSVAFGYLRRLQNGALSKVKVDSTGVLSLLYEQKLITGEKFAVASQLDALNLSKAPKVGVAFELS